MATTNNTEVPSDEAKLQNDNHKVICDLAAEYSEYMTFDVTNEKHQFEDSVEGMLARLEEYCGLVDTIRSDTTLCLQKTLPEICRTSAELETIFQRIDALETFVGVVKQNLNDLEDLVNHAEEDMGQFSSIKKMFTSFPSLLTKKSTGKPSSPKPVKFVPIDIFKTEDYLAPSSQKEAVMTSPDVTDTTNQKADSIDCVPQDITNDENKEPGNTS